MSTTGKHRLVADCLSSLPQETIQIHMIHKIGRTKHDSILRHVNLCHFFSVSFVFFVVKFYHEGHKGSTKFTKKLTFYGVARYIL